MYINEQLHAIARNQGAPVGFHCAPSHLLVAHHIRLTCVGVEPAGCDIQSFLLGNGQVRW
jgi:hypothetical protein